MVLRGAKGGDWDVCTHLINYGHHFEARFAKALSIFVKLLAGAPTVLEFGCGTGLYVAYLAKVATVSDAVGIEPQHSNHWSSLGLIAPSGLPRQANVDVLTASEKTLHAHNLHRQYDLVYSNEVVEHIPRHLHDRIFDFLVARTKRLLVFGMAVPGQGGHGHIACRDREDVRKEFIRRGLRPLSNLSRSLWKIGLRGITENRYVYAKDDSIPDLPSPELRELHVPWGHRSAAWHLMGRGSRFMMDDTFANETFPTFFRVAESFSRLRNLSMDERVCDTNNLNLA